MSPRHLGRTIRGGPIYRPFMLQRNRRRSQCSSRPRTACHRETHCNALPSFQKFAPGSPSLQRMRRFVFFHRLRTQWPYPRNFSRQMNLTHSLGETLKEKRVTVYHKNSTTGSERRDNVVSSIFSQKKPNQYAKPCSAEPMNHCFSQ